MFGSGLLKGLGVTLKHLADTYLDDVRHIPSRYAYGYDAIRQTPQEKGLFTIQYPEEKRQLPEAFRYIPMLIYDTPKGEDRCTACGICAKVCPPQCIWIVRDKDVSGKPVPRPSEFFIDASICMSCGFCAEFCPFDAIKMNHDYELAVYDRFPDLVYNKVELTVPVEYYASIYPTQFAVEEKRRAEEEAKKAKKPARGEKGAAPAKAAAAPAAAPAAPAPATAAAVAATSGTLSAEELERRRAEAKARVAARKGETVEAPAAAAPAAAATAAAAEGRTSGTLSPEELERRRAEAKARVAARKGETVEAPAAAAPAAVQPVVEAAKPAAAVAVAAGSPFAKQAADPSKTSGGYTLDQIAARRAAAYDRYKARKGADAKQLHGADQPVAVAAPAAAPAPAAPPAAPQAAPAAAPAAAQPAPAPAPKAAASGSPFAKQAADPSKTSGGYTVDEIARRRAEAYERYKARKGADAKDLTGH